jgi:hypothetical protein
MSKPNKYAAIELLSEPTTTGCANTNDWIASMRSMALMYAGDLDMQMLQQSEDAADVEIARARLAEIKESPGSLVSGKSLRKRLSRIEM